MLRALTAEQLMATASGEDLAKARRRLRAMQRNRGQVLTGKNLGMAGRNATDPHIITTPFYCIHYIDLYIYIYIDHIWFPSSHNHNHRG